MQLITLVTLSLLLFSSAGAAWVSVRLASDSWVAIKEVTPGKRYFLHPEALVTELKLTTGCTASDPTQLTVQLWNQKTLDEANDAIKSSGFCNGSCRVEPYQASSVLMENVFSALKIRRNKRLVPMTLPSTIKFEVDRIRRTRCAYINRQDISGLAIKIETKNEGSIPLTLDTSRLEKVSSRTFAVPRKSNVALKLEAASKMEKELVSLRTSLATVKQWRKIKQNAETQCAALEEPLAALVKTSAGVPIISDCLDVKLRGLLEGIYFLKPPGRAVFCTATGELVVLRRTKLDLSFDKDWASYRAGLGDPKMGDFFSGLDLLSQYTAPGDRCMRMILTPNSAKVPTRMAQFSQFRIGPENTNFVLNYEGFSGTMTTDPWSYQRGKEFKTRDRPQGDRCSQMHFSGNWYNSCSNINLFGKRGKKFSAIGMKAGRYETASYVILKSAYMTLRKPGGDPAALRTISTNVSISCPTVAQDWTAPVTGEYLLTVGGAAGGTSPHFNSRRGGRGAVVRSRVLLQRATKLRLVIGCAGATGHTSGAGGDGSFVANWNSSKLLVAAGGGGGAGWIDGGHGRLEKTGGGPILRPDDLNSTSARTRAFSWSDIAPQVLRNEGKRSVSTGGRTYMDSAPSSYAAGGGGGLEPGMGAEERKMEDGGKAPRQSAGGGGGSGCGDEALSCETEAGGNKKRDGFISVGIYRCF